MIPVIKLFSHAVVGGCQTTCHSLQHRHAQVIKLMGSQRNTRNQRSVRTRMCCILGIILWPLLVSQLQLTCSSKPEMEYLQYQSSHVFVMQNFCLRNIVYKLCMMEKKNKIELFMFGFLILGKGQRNLWIRLLYLRFNHDPIRIRIEYNQATKQQQLCSKYRHVDDNIITCYRF